MTYYEKLQSVGLPDTRINSLYDAANTVHSAIALLDPENIELVKKHFPELMAVANRFGNIEPMLRSWDDN
tara:strand:+ start:308 stop:517 length:210 start_codon:yes stop_codon:yes gene_type:complete